MKDVRDVMKELTKQELIEIYNSLNHWKWDSRLGDKPYNWDNLPDFNLSSNHTANTKYELLKPYTTYIKEKVSNKELLKYHHLTSLGMTRLQHEIWWIKRTLSKAFNLGFYSKTNKKMIKEILQNIAVDNTQSRLKDVYNND